MQNLESALKKLSDGELDSLTSVEKKLLTESLESEDLSEFKEILELFMDSKIDLEPSIELKNKLINHFNFTKQSTLPKIEVKAESTSIVNLFKLAAAALVILAFASAFFLYTSNSAEPSVAAMGIEDFHQFTQSERIQNEKDTLAEETKYLMSMDFFSNASITLEFD